ncbi:UxaA family hydrolase [Mucilaginibacter sp. UYCu711]|uniref:UxaA family hydrolase n=1 Tax=Mucilaginibacter sp. UYCu711 TaxID=3156339 RepID=UPI003D1F929C
MQSFIHLHERDNVVIALKNFNAGETILLNGESIQLPSAIFFGHKIAVKAISANEKVLKYGLPIGRATQEVKPGEHVHSHNLKTDYKSINE